MFTGLIETTGEVAAVTPSAGRVRGCRSTTTLDRELTPGDSLAVNGVCLTVVTAAAGAGIAHGRLARDARASRRWARVEARHAA